MQQKGAKSVLIYEKCLPLHPEKKSTSNILNNRQKHEEVINSNGVGCEHECCCA